jgi:predicted esterase
LDGWGLNSPVYFPLGGQVDTDLLPAPRASLERGSSLVIVNVDEGSPYFGERYPVRWHFQEQPTAYQGKNVLAVSPVHGFPLRPRTTHAFLLSTAIVSRDQAFDEEWNSDAPEYASLKNALWRLGMTEDDVGVASLITTGDPVREMAIISDFLHEAVGLPSFALTLEWKRDYKYFRAFRTHYPGPRFTFGERPYLYTGGEFRFDEQGVPLIEGWDDMRLSVCTPFDLENPPEGGWPVVIYQHGTGGDYDGFCNSNRYSEVASRLGSNRIVGLGIDQPLHGTRTVLNTTAPDLAHFNLVNPYASRSNFRQGALDAIYLAHALAEQQVVFATPDGDSIPLNPEKVMFMGHSQGGITGAIALPFMGDDIQSAMLSGAGGMLAIAVVHRKDPLDFAELVHGLLRLDEGEELYELHPVLGLVQQLIDVTDPVNYAPYWFHEPSPIGTRPVPVLASSGIQDAATPYMTAIALATAGRLPAVHPRASQANSLDLRGLSDVYSPVLNNATAWTGESITAAFSQWRQGDHFVVFDDPEATAMYEEFFVSTVAGESMIVVNTDP